MAVGRAMKRGLKRAGAADDAAFEELKQITATIGAPIIPALAEVLATEENAKGRKRLRGILMEFGDLAIASMHELM
ncbi:MAG: hypothetical protein CL471_15690 [Acidobacteria bacterium]|nr:hypothetical protein [Acidobacteriota bacterium]